MNPQFVIAKTKKQAEFFAASSAFDSPKWVQLSEATVYVSAERAEKAAKSLMKNGSFNATVIPFIQEQMLPVTNLAPTNNLPAEEELDMGAEDEEEHNQMVARSQEEVCPSCNHEPCTCQSEENEERTNARFHFTPGSSVGYQGKKCTVADVSDLGLALIVDASGKKHKVDVRDLTALSESAPPIRKTDNPAPSVGNNTTIPSPKFNVAPVLFKNDSRQDQELEFGGDPLDKAVSIPAEIKSQLAKALAAVKAQVKSKTTDDVTVSFYMTAEACLETLTDLLHTGTVESLSAANTEFLSWMSPIQHLVPATVQKFILSGGRRSSLKDAFEAKRKERV